MKKGPIIGIIVLALLPVFINYGLFTWRAPRVEGDANAWLGFFGSYLGFIGAISIAIYQIKKQKERDDEQEEKQKEKERQQDLESKRSFVVVNDMRARLKLENIKTHENSRIIETPGYRDILRRVGNRYKDINTTYLNISQYGNSPAIMNCKIHVEYSRDDDKSEELETHIGVLEQGIEVFIPIVPVDAKIGELVGIDTIEVEYQTLSGEKMKWEIRHLEDIEYYSYFDQNGNEQKLFETTINSATWTYPNKLKEVLKEETDESTS